MAEVFLARQTGLEGFDRLCALKKILPHLVASRQFVDMFLDEARLASQLRHPNVVHIYDFGKVDDAYFIAMEYVDGVGVGSLIQHAAREPIPFALVARIGASACAGLDHAHNLRDVEGNPLALVHRDVSPPNLLISYEGAIKLVDFGIAKAESSIEQTRPGVVKGKYAYMSPEQTIGSMLDGRSDVFSLGVVLWELLAGRAAVRRDDPIEGMKVIRDGKIPPIITVRRDTPPELARAIDAALSADPDRRVSALELGLAVERFISHSQAMSSNLELAQWLRDKFPRSERPDLPEPGATSQATAATGQFELAEAKPTQTPEPSQPPAPANADRTTLSAPLFPDGSPLAGPTEIAIGLETPSLKPKPSRTLLVGAGVALVAAITFTIFALRGASDQSVSVADPAAAVEDARATSATLEVVAEPSASTILIDDEPVDGVTELSPGAHSIVVSKRGYKTETRLIELAARESHTIELALKRTRVARQKQTRPSVGKTPPPSETPKSKTGVLRARSIPWAHVYLRGKKLGTTPINVELPVGKHRIQFKNPEHGLKKSRTVTVKPDGTAILNIKLH